MGHIKLEAIKHNIVVRYQTFPSKVSYQDIDIYYKTFPPRNKQVKYITITVKDKKYDISDKAFGLLYRNSDNNNAFYLRSEQDFRHRLEKHMAVIAAARNLEYTSKESSKMIKHDLYEVKAGEYAGKYVYKLALNSLNQAVVEVKGTGETFAIELTDLEKVMPFTVDVAFDNSGTKYSYFADKDVFEVGDLVLLNDRQRFVSVVAVDTKSESATKRLVGSLIKVDKVISE